jgi:hypothetical protein
MEIIAQNEDFDIWVKSLENPFSDDPFDFGVPAAPFDRSVLDRTYRAVLAPEGKDWQGKVWRFPDGSMEISVTRVDALDRMANSRYWMMGMPIRSLSGAEDHISDQMLDEEIAEYEARKVVDNRNRAARRAAQKVRHLIKMVGADHMLTLSYRDNMQDVDKLKSDWKRFVRLMHARYPEWQFVAIRERQERGALHLHVAVVGRQDIKYIRRCWYVALGASPGVTGDATPGQIDVRAPSKAVGRQGVCVGG